MSFESMLSFNAIYKIDMFSVIEVVAVILSMYTFHVVHVDTWSTISALLHDTFAADVSQNAQSRVVHQCSHVQPASVKSWR